MVAVVEPFWVAAQAGLAAVVFSAPAWGAIGLGITLGMVVGIVPGFGPPAAMALLFPLVYVLPPLHAVSLLAGIFYGAKYGGAVTSIVVGLPGEADAVATVYEGYPLARAGKATQALRLAVLSSFVGGMGAVLGLIGLTPWLGAAAVQLGPSGRLLIMGGALLLVALLGAGGFRKNMLMVIAGMVLALVGLDPIYGSQRLTFGSWRLFGGIELGALLLGLFGLGDIVHTLVYGPGASPHSDGEQAAPQASGPIPVPELHRGRVLAAAGRGTLIGFGVGLTPSGAGVTSSLASYALERRISREPHSFGHGQWTGLAGPEASNNAAAIASFAPLLLLGLPTNPVMAAMLGALTVGGAVPGPQMPTVQPELYWGIVGSLALGNILLVFSGLILARLWARLARIPYAVLWPLVFVLCLAGAWLTTENLVGPAQCFAFGLLAPLLRTYGYSPSPLILGFVLGPLLEHYLIQILMAG